MNEAVIPRPRLLEAEAVARRVAEVVARRGLPPLFADWVLTAHNGRFWLFGVLDLARIGRLEQYTTPDLLHHLSTAIGGRPVEVSNTSGLRYAILLSRPPRLPRQADFPGLTRGIVLLGIAANGQVVAVPWADLGHLLVAGITGSGKSSFLRLLAYQAIAEGSRLILGDLDGATFPMLTEHPALLAPIARTPEEFDEAVRRALGEVDHRARLYARTPGYPETLDEYNGLAVRAGQEPLPRLLVILDEFNAVVMALGGPRREFAASVARLSWQGRKFGIHLVFAAQDFSKEVIGRVRDQVMAAVCFRVRSGEMARAVGCVGAERIPADRPGRAVTDRWGVIQAFHLPKAALAGAPAAALTEQEQAIVRWALEENGGYLGLADLQGQFGLGQREARRLAEEWERRGWLEKDARAGNRRRVSAALAALANKATNPTKPDNLTKGG
ncbi:MAG: FtsK/SpoIIIE domain-containing protein [Anaerolineae bacterium]|nr:FtsK/SpoIIIE domain-containing protein [Anaerolineae bacterium]